MIYTIDNKTYDKLPDPCKGASPMTEARFIEMGGTITKGPKEFFLDGLDAYLDELEEQVTAAGLSITKEDFKEAASTMLSSDLIAWAKDEKGVPDEMIEAVRKDVLTKVADASRLGLTWNDLFPKVNA